MLILILLAGPLLHLQLVSSFAISSQTRGRSTLRPRDSVNGSCISAPDDGTTSLVGLCVNKIARGQIAPNAFWTDPLCVAAATGSSMGSLVDAACCAGTCKRPKDTGNLDVAHVYHAMVGSGCTATPASKCNLTWQPFVDFIYSTIQATSTQIWPDSGDVILDRWEEIATWTGFCAGNRCADGAIPYSNFNDWFHYSSSVIQTAPGTPQYAWVFPTVDENLDNTTPNVFWACVFDDPKLCSWDWAPPPPGTFDSTSEPAVVRAVSPVVDRAAVMSASAMPDPGPRAFGQFGLAPHQPPNVPPPVYADGQLIPLVLNGMPVIWDADTRYAVSDSHPITLRPTATQVDDDALPHRPTRTSKRAIVTDKCEGPTDVPSVLPTLTYYCDKLPQICANIRSHPNWDSATDTMKLTYDPWDGGRRRRDVCKSSVTSAMRDAGKCDPRQHSAYHWKISCDEFPFSASLEGGSGNTVVAAVSDYEQQLQSSLQSAITHLRTNQKDKRTKWSAHSKCHRYTLKLAPSTPSGASSTAVGFLNAGSDFFAEDGVTSREVTNKHAVDRGPPAPFTTDMDYPPTATALMSIGRKELFDCTPCGSDSPVPTSPPDDFTSPAEHSHKRQVSSCTVRPTTAPLPTSSAEASAIAANSASLARVAAAAAAAAFASASSPAPDLAEVAAAAVAAADILGPAAAALAAAGTDSSLASAIASSQSVTSIAQTALDRIFSLGPGIPSWLSDIINHVSLSCYLGCRGSPVIDPSHDPNVVSPPPDAPAAACFGAGSRGILKVGDSPFVDSNGPVPAVLVDVGSAAYFGLTIGTNRVLGEVSGCNGVYEWIDSDLQPNFQVDCATMELGSYWSGVQQTCYTYALPSTIPGINLFTVFCGTDVANIYSCLQQQGLYGDLQSAFINWATS